MASSEVSHPKVFISYSHDSHEHEDRVLALSDRLCADGIDCILDQYEDSPPEGFPRWMDRQIRSADFVLMICTPTYYNRVMGEEVPGKGLGVQWESTLIYQYIYNSGASNMRFIPILFEGLTTSSIPTPWQGVKYYRPSTDEGYEELYRRLTKQPRTSKPELGRLRTLSSSSSQKASDKIVKSASMLAKELDKNSSNIGEQKYRDNDNASSDDLLSMDQHRPDVFYLHRPRNYIPFPRNPLFQARPGEFQHLAGLLFGSETSQHSIRLGLIGVTGMGGIGKTQLAVEFAYRCLDEQRFPGGIFWMSAAGTTVLEWQRQLTELAFKTGYLPSNDDISNPENEARRARHLCSYLANHADALLILDNVDDPTMVTSVLPALAGSEVACTLLYTSRSAFAPFGVKTYTVEQLPEEAALRLLLDGIRPSLLQEVQLGSQSLESSAARSLCRSVGYLPLALVHLRGLLARDHEVTLERFREVLQQRGALHLAKTHYLDAPSLFETFRLSWEKVQHEDARRMFKLASYFPEASPIPLWLLGIATGLGEVGDILEPLGEACLQLREASLLENLSKRQVRLHPLVREFGRMLIAEDKSIGEDLLRDAGGRLVTECINLKRLEQRALREGYWECLQQLRAILTYLELLGISDYVEQVERIERWLDRESYLLGNDQWWPTSLPELFHQQLFNRSVEDRHQLIIEGNPTRWLKLKQEVGVEDRSLLRIFTGHTASVNSVAFSPDGSMVLTGSSDCTACLWETSSGKLLGIFTGHTASVNSVAFSPDGSMVLTGSSDGTVRLWETSSGKLLGILQSLMQRLKPVTHTPDGRIVFILSDNGTRYLWETFYENNSGKLLSLIQVTTLKSFNKSIKGVAFSPDGRQVLIASDDGTAWLWETSSGKLLTTLQGHTASIKNVRFSFDGVIIHTGADDGTVRVWETSSGQQLGLFENRTIESFSGRIHNVAFSPDGGQILTGSDDGTAWLWQTANGKLLKTLRGDGTIIFSVAHSPDGKQVLIGDAGGTVWLWDSQSRRKLLAALRGHISWVKSLAFSPNGKLVLTGGNDRTAKLWNISGREMPLPLNLGPVVLNVVFSMDGKLALTGLQGSTAQLWETGSGKLLTTFKGHSPNVIGVALSPDGKQALIGSGIGPIWLREISSGELLAKLRGHTRMVRRAMFSSDGRYLITGAEEEDALLWEITSGTLLARLKGHTWVTGVAFSFDGKQVLTGSNDGILQLWETGSGNRLVRLQGHTSSISSVAFSPDSRLAITGSYDETVRLWDIDKRKQIFVFKYHTSEVSSVAFSPDGKSAISGDANGWVFIWDVAGFNKGHLRGLYKTAYQVGAIYWNENEHLILADRGGSQRRPHFYHIAIEGMK